MAAGRFARACRAAARPPAPASSDAPNTRPATPPQSTVQVAGTPSPPRATPLRSRARRRRGRRSARRRHTRCRRRSRIWPVDAPSTFKIAASRPGCGRGRRSRRPAPAAPPSAATRRRAANSQGKAVEQIGHGAERLAYADDIDARKISRQRRGDAALLGRSRFGDGDAAQIRPCQGGRVDNEWKVRAEPAKVDVAQGGDPRVEAPTEHFEGDRVANVEICPLGRLGRHGDQRRSGVVGAPPPPRDYPDFAGSAPIADREMSLS